MAGEKILVCTTCGKQEGMGPAQVPGQQLFSALSSLVPPLNVVASPCMGVCDKGCGVAFAAPGKITWVFQAQSVETAPDIAQTFTLYQNRATGQMLQEERAPHLKTQVFCKVPAVS